MNDNKFNEIRDFCIKNSNPEIVKKYSRYFKEGYDGYGIEKMDKEYRKRFRKKK